MKRSALFLSLALVLVLSFGAAAQLKLSGLAEFHFGIRQKKVGSDLKDLEFFGKGRRNIALTWTAPSGSAGNLKLTLSLASGGNSGAGGANDFVDWKTDAYNPGAGAISLDLNSARIAGTGALWKNGPNITLTAGRYTASYSPWVAHNSARSHTAANAAANAFRNAVEVKGFSVGPFAISAIHGFAATSDQPTFLHASGNVGGITTKLTAVNREQMAAPADDYVWDFAAELGMKPANNLTLDAAVAIDGQGRGYTGAMGTEVAPALATRLDAKYTGIAATTLDASVWYTEELFAPRYAQYATGSGGSYNKFQVDRQGFKIAGKTTQAGVDLNAGFEMANKISDSNWNRNVINAGIGTKVDIFTVSADVTLTDTNGAKETKTVLKASTKLADVSLGYTGTITKTGTADSTMKNEITAGTTQDLFFADKVALHAAVIKDGDKDLQYGADAKWTAPIGLDIKVGYANYKKSARNEVHGNGQVDGFYIMGSKLITF